jgi:hypothetical protein
MNNPLADLIFNTNDIPEDKSDGSSEFWNIASSPAFKSICLITMMQLIPDRHPSELTDEECRSILASIYTAKVMLRQPDNFKQIQKKKEEERVAANEPPDPLYRDPIDLKQAYRPD